MKPVIIILSPVQEAWGERELSEYLEDYHISRGYMVSFNFNQKKKTGMQEIHLADKTLVEVVV